MDAKTLKAMFGNVLRAATTGSPVTFEQKDGLLYASCVWCGCEVTQKLGPAPFEEFACRIPSERVKGAVSTIEGEVNLSLRRDGLDIDSAIGAIHIPGIEPYVSPETKDGGREILAERLGTKEVQGACKDLILFTDSNRTSVPALSYLVCDGERLSAIDGFRIVEIRFTKGESLNKPVLIPKACARLFGMAKELGAYTDLVLERGQVYCLKSGNFSVRWPDEHIDPLDLQEILGRFEPSVSFVGDRKKLLRAAETVKRLGEDSKNPGILELSFTGGSLDIAAHCAGGVRFEAQIAGEGEGAGVPLGMSPAFLCQHLKQIKDKEVTCETNGTATSPLRIVSGGGLRTDFILPILLKKDMG